MRVADMWFSLDLKLHEEHYGTETGTGGNDRYDPTDGWADDYGRMTSDQKGGLGMRTTGRSAMHFVKTHRRVAHSLSGSISTTCRIIWVRSRL